MIMESKFDFYENVIIKCCEKKYQYLNGKKGSVLGKSADDKKNWYYFVSIENGESFSFKEEELESLGTFAKREDFYSGESIRVGVNKKGEGYIIGDDK